MTEFIKELKTRRKVALRLGRLSENDIVYNLKPKITKKLLNGSIGIEDITEKDVYLSIGQKGIDFILDPLWNPINEDLHEHIDGLKSCIWKNGEK